MPYSKDISDFQRWIDGIFNSAGIVSLESCYDKPVKIVFEGEKTKKTVSPFEIQSVLSNRKKNAFTVVWADGTHTTVHCQSGDEWDDEKALAMCFTKKALGNKGNFNDKFNDALDNKMKVIPAGPAPEKTCDCEREKVTRVAETIEKVRTSADKATTSFTEMIEALTDKSAKIPPLEGQYRVFIRIGGVSHHDSDFTSVPALRNRIHEIAEELYGKEPYYYRTWMNGDRMVIDFGHYTQFIEVEGITPDEYAKH